MPFGDFAQSVGERAEPKDAQEEIYVGLEHLDSQCLHIRRWGKGSDVTGGKLRFRKGDIIFGKRRAYQRKLAVAEFGGICSAHAMVIRAKTDKVLPEFLPFLMMSDRFMNRAVEISVGSLSPTINWTTLKLETFDLPPLDQQRRIAEILWAMDVESEAKTAALQALEAYKSSMVKREVETIKAHWKTESFEQIVAESLLGTAARGTDDTPTLQLIKMGNLTWGGYQLSDVELISESKLDSLDRLILKKGDYLFNTRNTPELVGKSAVWKEAEAPSICDNNILRCRFKHNVNPHFVCYQLTTGAGRRSLNRLASGSTSVAAIYWSSLKNLSVSLPSRAEQDRICEQLHELEQCVCDAQRALSGSALLLNQLSTAVFSSED